MAERELSQTDLSRLMDPDDPEKWRSRIVKYCGLSSGKPARMGREVAQQFADVLGVTVDDVLDYSATEAQPSAVPQEGLDLLAAQVSELDAKLERLERTTMMILDELRRSQPETRRQDL